MSAISLDDYDRLLDMMERDARRAMDLEERNPVLFFGAFARAKEDMQIVQSLRDSACILCEACE